MNPYAVIKTTKVDPAVLSVLAEMQWTVQGQETHGVIVAQLERKLYLKTAKVLKALGGKWSRKAKAHVFEHDPRPGLGIVIENGTVEIVKDGFYETPRSVGIVMAEMADIQPGMDVLEPSAGKGALICAILEVQPECNVLAIEIDDERRAGLERDGYVVVDRDFLTHWGTYDRIVQNPPFEQLQDIDHVMHAWECLRPGGVLVSVMCESAFFRNDRKAREFRVWLVQRDARVIALDEGAFKEGGTMIKTRLVRIAKGS